MNSNADDREPRHDWRRLLELLGPVHAQAAGMARRLAGSAHDGDDLFQEAVLRAANALPSLQDETRFRSWFYTILLNVHRSRSRRPFWKRFLPFGGGTRDESEIAGVDGRAWEGERRQAERVSRALASLAAEQREAIVLFEIEGMPVEEIAALQDVSVSAVKSRLVRGRARLRRTYERWGFRGGARGLGPEIDGELRPALANPAQEEKDP